MPTSRHRRATYGKVLRFLPTLVMPAQLLGEALEVVEKAFAAET